MEKARASAKIMDSLKTSQGDVITSQEGIMREQTKFYRDIYSSNREFDANKANKFINGSQIPKLSEEQKTTLDTEISLAETAIALQSMKNNSAPGLDGITTSFLKFFWSKLNKLILESFNMSYTKGEMSVTQKQAVITLLHKGKNLPRDELANWRPISLTNTDYKVLAKCFALRLSKVITDIINDNQVGFIKGRQISTMIRLIDDAIDMMNTLDKPGILLAVDYRRAFDSVSKEFIVWAFKQFNFGEYFVRWVNVLTTNTESSIHYLGWLSESFPVNTGIRQGCPFSPLAFIIALEMLAIKIRDDNQIKGLEIPISASEVSPIHFLKILLYADDITLFLQDKDDMKRALDTIDKFSEFANLEINKNKTEAMWLGRLKTNKENLYDIKFKEKVKIVGIVFNNSIPASQIEENWYSRLEKIQQIMVSWSKRNLSISGKLCIIKTFLISQFVHVMQALILPPQVLNNLNTILFRFLWKKKFTNTRAFEKVKRVVLCNEIDKGGLNMIDIKTMQASFVLNWAFKLLQSNGEIWSVFPRYLFSKLGVNLSCFLADTKPKLFSGLGYIKSEFWKQVLITWLDNMQNLKNNSIIEVNHSNLWNNTQIVFRNKPLFFKDWVNAGICFISDIITDDQILSFEDLCQKVGRKATRQFEYNALHTSLRARTAHTLLQFSNSDQDKEVKIQNKITSRIIRIELSKSTVEPCGQRFWQQKYGLVLTDQNWLVAHRSTKEERLRLLHWKLLHNIYPTNILLHKMGIKNSIKCSFCNENDYIEHFFFRCQKIKKVWDDCIGYIYKHTNEKVSLQETDILFGYKPNDAKHSFVRFVNHIILITKMVISKFRYGYGYDISILFERETDLRTKFFCC